MISLHLAAVVFKRNCDSVRVKHAPSAASVRQAWYLRVTELNLVSVSEVLLYEVGSLSLCMVCPVTKWMFMCSMNIGISVWLCTVVIC